MGKIDLRFIFSFIFTLGLFLTAAFIPTGDLWGFNHLQYLPPKFLYLTAVVGLISFIAIIFEKRLEFFDFIVDRICAFIWSPRIWHRAVLIAGIIILFYSLRLKIFFLGDGYSLLSVFGQGELYLHKWTVPLSSYWIRWIQEFLGGYTRETSQTAFQILSIVSGAIVVNNLIAIVELLSTDNRKRVIGIATFIFSGSILLFFGYVEFYPIVWAATTAFFYSSLKYLKTDKGLMWVALSFALATAIHLQVVMYVGGLGVILFHKLLQRKIVIFDYRFKVVVIVFALAIAPMLIFAAQHFVSDAAIVLPVLSNDNQSIDYSIFSWLHLSDIINQLFLIFPGILMLAFITRIQFKSDSISWYLILCALGGALWLFLIDPGLGMARDWDLFSISVLPLGLFVFHATVNNDKCLSAARVFCYLILSLIITASFIMVNFVLSASEDRFLDLVRRYKARDYAGWSALSYYYYNKKDFEKSKLIADEMIQYLPVRGKVIQAQIALDMNQPERALSIGLDLFKSEKNNSDVLHLLAKAYKQLKEYELSEKYYLDLLKMKRHSRIANELGQLYLETSELDKAIEIFKEIRKSDPTLTNVTEGLGLAYFRKGENESALAIADSLFMDDRNSPGGHLIKMVVAISRGAMDSAKSHFMQYLKYGKNRTDFENIKQYYSYLK